MNYKKKKLKMQIVTMLLILSLLFTSCSEIGLNSFEIKSNSKESIIDEFSYLKFLNQYYDEDSGGYTEIRTSYNPDALYFTYYSMATLKKIDKDKYEKYRSDIENWHRSIDINTILADQNYDVLDNIYYYFKLADIMELQIEKDKYTSLMTYLNNTQQIDGYFYVSNKHKKGSLSKSEKATDPMIILRTLQAVELLAKSGKKDFGALNTWIHEIHKAIINENDNMSRLKYLNVYLKIHEILQEPVPENISEIAKEVLEILKKNMPNYKDTYLINSIYELDTYIYKDVNNHEYISKYSEILIDNESALNEKFHILFYYYISNAYQNQNLALPNVDTIVNNILIRKIPRSYFTATINNEVNIIATNYAFKVLDMLGQTFDVSVFLEKSRENIESKSVLEKIYYLDIINNYGDRTNKSKKMLNSLFTDASKVNFEEQNKSSNYMLLLNLIDATRNYSNEIPRKLAQRIVEYAEKLRTTDNKFNIATFINNCIDVRMLRALSPNSKTIAFKEKIIIDNINEHYDNLEENIRLYLLYWGVSALHENDRAIDSITIDRESIRENIEKYRVNGLYSISDEPSPSMESQYIALFLLKKL